MKKTIGSLRFWIPGFLLALLAYAAGTAQGKAPQPQQVAGDALRWHIVSNPGDSSKTFLIDTLVGDSYVLSSSDEQPVWKKIKGK